MQRRTEDTTVTFNLDYLLKVAQIPSALMNPQPRFSPWEGRASNGLQVAQIPYVPMNPEPRFSSSEGWASNGIQGPRSRQNSTTNPRYKTQLCKSVYTKTQCGYAEVCKYAHSSDELRAIPRTENYQTKLCQSYWESGFCVYGARCLFVHLDDPNNVLKPAGSDEIQIPNQRFDIPRNPWLQTEMEAKWYAQILLQERFARF